MNRMAERSHAQSNAWFARALAVTPGGVHSPVRAFKAVGGAPVVMASAQGAHLRDADGNEYIDFCMSWGPLILGHADARVVAAVTRAAALGTSFGACSMPEVELAERVARMNPWAQRVRFVSSGTEAVMSALRLARGFTGRDLVIKFAGCYHGHADAFLVKAGSGLATFGTSSSAGVPEAVSALTIVLPLGDFAALGAAEREFGGRLAAVVIEPIPANDGLLLQAPEFLRALRQMTARTGALLIFDEVISGFRVAAGGAAAHYGIEPDLVTYGKIIGGGLPVGAFAGRADIMAHLAPEGRVYQAGTLSGNPVAMAAGIATLDALAAADGRGRDFYEILETQTGSFLKDLIYVLSKVGGQLVRVGSIYWPYFGEGEPPVRPEQISAGHVAFFRRLFPAALERGVYLPPSAHEVWFLSAAHTEKILAEAVNRLEDALAAVG